MNRKDVSKISLKSEVRSQKTKDFLDKKLMTRQQQLATDSAAGFPPFLRGNKAMMHILNPWKTYNDIDNPIEVLSHFSEDIITEITNTLLSGLKSINIKLKEGFTIDKITPKLIFKWNSSENHFDDIIKIKVARILWTKLLTPFNPKNQESLQLTSYFITKKNTNNLDNITTNTIQGLSGVFAGVEILDTQTQINDFLQHKINITKTIDPWAGSFELEKQTEDLANKAWEIIQEKLNQQNN